MTCSPCWNTTHKLECDRLKMAVVATAATDLLCQEEVKAGEPPFFLDPLCAAHGKVMKPVRRSSLTHSVILLGKGFTNMLRGLSSRWFQIPSSWQLRLTTSPTKNQSRHYRQIKWEHNRPWGRSSNKVSPQRKVQDQMGRKFYRPLKKNSLCQCSSNASINRKGRNITKLFE